MHRHDDDDDDGDGDTGLVFARSAVGDKSAVFGRRMGLLEGTDFSYVYNVPRASCGG